MSQSVTPKPIIAVAYYSTYGHIKSLVDAAVKGAEATGAAVKVYAIKETLPEEVLKKMYAGSSLNPAHPLFTPDAFKECDGLILAAPTRYGRVPAQVSQFFDQTGGLWASGALVGKFVTMMTSTAGQHGGQETTYLTTYPFFAHHGLVYVPIGYQNSIINDNSVVQGGSPYGASTIAGSDGARQPTEAELSVAEFQGKYFSEFVTKFVKGSLRHAEAQPVLAKALPVAAATEGEKEGYKVEDKETAPAVAPAPAAAPEPTQVPEPVPAPAQSTVNAATPGTAAPAAATAAPPKKKKGGLFASCCGKGDHIE